MSVSRSPALSSPCTLYISTTLNTYHTPFYSLGKAERAELTARIHSDLYESLIPGHDLTWVNWFSNHDTYIRKAAYQSAGRIYFMQPVLKPAVLQMLRLLMGHSEHSVRQTVINAAGEIGKKEFQEVACFFDTGLFDKHHAPRNAVIGSLKKMGEVNPKPVLAWAKKHLNHEDPEVRREICHGIELRGRKHPEDILPLLRELQHDQVKRVRSTLVHVLGQIAYKKGCLEKVLAHLQHWENKELVQEALEEILDVHVRYADFAHYSLAEAQKVVELLLGDVVNNGRKNSRRSR